MSQEIKYYSIQEVKIHNGKDDSRVWFIYKDSVYDVTDYLEEHPGGGDLITEYAGKDATRGFDDFGHSSDAKKMLKDYKIGEINEDERKGKKKKGAKNNVAVNNVPVHKPQTLTKYYSIEEVKIHNGKDDSRVWFIYKDSVYDVTDYLEEHPGGGELITEYAGKDATKGFDDFGHSSDAKKMLKDYKIGEINENERKGKKKGVTVKTAPAEKPQVRSCFSIITCGLCG